METYLQQLLAYFGDNEFVHAGVLVGIFLVLAFVADQLISRVLKVWARRTSTNLDDRIISLAHRPVFFSVLAVGLHMALAQLSLQPSVLQFFQRLILTLVVLTWLVFAFRASSIVLELLSHLEKRFTAVEPRTVALFNQVLRIVLAGGAVYFLFLIWGIDVGAWLAGAGIIGIAVGFAAKDTLANIFSGIFILADAPYQYGDFIVLDSGERGVVTQIGLRSTRLLTRDDIEITIPNAVIANAKILNESGGRWEKERVRVQVGVAYGSDIDQVEAILLELAAEHPEIDQEPAPRVRFRAFGASGLDLELLGWIHQPVLRGRVVHELNTAIYKRFNREGIEIPYPKRDVYLHRTEPARAEEL
jgi:MscS family membrane protein